MLKKNLAALFVLFLAIFIFGSAVSAQETVAAAESHLLQVMLPANAQRVLPQSVPAEITETLKKVTAAANGKFRQGETEVLLWAGGSYKKANAAGILNRLTGSLKTAGWQYSVEGEENGVTLFSALQQSQHRAVVGFYGATDDALIFTAMEILPNGGVGNGRGETAQNQTRNEAETEQQGSAVQTKSAGRDNGSILGEWSTGYVSRTRYAPQIGPQLVTPGKTRVWTYNFHPNGTYEFTGIMEIVMGGCKTTYFQDKRGRYTINGDQITLTLTKNLWRKGESCAASGNIEREGEHQPETYTLSVKRDENGNDQVCLSGAETGTNGCFGRKKD